MERKSDAMEKMGDTDVRNFGESWWLSEGIQISESSICLISNLPGITEDKLQSLHVLQSCTQPHLSYCSVLKLTKGY